MIDTNPSSGRDLVEHTVWEHMPCCIVEKVAVHADPSAEVLHRGDDLVVEVAEDMVAAEAAGTVIVVVFEEGDVALAWLVHDCRSCTNRHSSLAVAEDTR